MSARSVQATADLLTAQADVGFGVESVPEAGVLRREGGTLVASLRAEAGALPPDPPPEAAARRRASQEAVLEAWGGRDRSEIPAVVGIVWIGEVLHVTDLAVRDAADSVAAVAPPG